MQQNFNPTADRAGIMDTLVNTYRELNTKFRQLEESRLPAGARDIIDRMRRDEMLFAQALKERVTGVGTAVSGERDIFGNDDPDASVAQLISQFGTARATTLTLIKDLSDSDWDRQLDDGKTMFDHIRDLSESDRNQMARLTSA